MDPRHWHDDDDDDHRIQKPALNPRLCRSIYIIGTMMMMMMMIGARNQP
jgi:hypothetical protein